MRLKKLIKKTLNEIKKINKKNVKWDLKKLINKTLNEILKN